MRRHLDTILDLNGSNATWTAVYARTKKHLKVVNAWNVCTPVHTHIHSDAFGIHAITTTATDLTTTTRTLMPQQ